MQTASIRTVKVDRPQDPLVLETEIKVQLSLGQMQVPVILGTDAFQSGQMQGFSRRQMQGFSQSLGQMQVPFVLVVLG
jgi:hypothetical protein